MGSVTSDLGLRCLTKYYLWDARHLQANNKTGRHIYVNEYVIYTFFNKRWLDGNAWYEYKLFLNVSLLLLYYRIKNFKK